MIEKDERYTPSRVWGAVASSLGPFEDVCPRLGSSGLEGVWQPRVYCNPPGSLKRDFAAKFRAEFEADHPLEAGIWMEFSADHSTTAFADVMGAAEAVGGFVVPLRDRWRFLDPGGREIEVGRSQTVVLVGDCDPEPWRDLGWILRVS